MNPTTHVFLDFDETIFSYRAFNGWLAGILAAREMPADAYLQSYGEYHQAVDDSGLHRLYDHDRHAADKLGIAWSELEEIITLEAGETGLDFCYPETHEFISNLKHGGSKIGLLTYGKPDYQLFKIGLCHELRGLPVYVVRVPKRDFLREYFADRHIKGVLIDDKQPLHLPCNWQHIWISRNHQSDTEGLYDHRVTNLSEALPVLLQ